MLSSQDLIRLQMQLYQGEVRLLVPNKQANASTWKKQQRISYYNWNLANFSSFSDRLMISLSPDTKIRISLPTVASSFTSIITNSS